MIIYDPTYPTSNHLQPLPARSRKDPKTWSKLCVSKSNLSTNLPQGSPKSLVLESKKWSYCGAAYQVPQSTSPWPCLPPWRQESVSEARRSTSLALENPKRPSIRQIHRIHSDVTVTISTCQRCWSCQVTGHSPAVKHGEVM